MTAPAKKGNVPAWHLQEIILHSDSWECIIAAEYFSGQEIIHPRDWIRLLAPVSSQYPAGRQYRLCILLTFFPFASYVLGQDKRKNIPFSLNLS